MKILLKSLQLKSETDNNSTETNGDMEKKDVCRKRKFQKGQLQIEDMRVKKTHGVKNRERKGSREINKDSCYKKASARKPGRR